MIVQLDKIPEEGLHFSGEEAPEILELDADPVFSSEDAVRCELYAQVVSGSLVVRGTVSAKILARCARCAQIFSTTVIDSGFLRDYSDVDEMEEIDITEGIRETLILNLPPFPLCDDACKGLCPQCGKNMNQAVCDCLAQKKIGAWEALDNLKL